MDKSTVLSVVLVTLVSFVYDQSPAQPDIIPPSPQAASLGKYSQIPVNYYTGTPQIEIPMYTVSINDIQLPIPLSYHASVIKVEEIVSWLGLGWNLNVNGAITRVMGGKPDESAPTSLSRDYWGYYNGASNSSLMPALSTDESAQYQSHPLLPLKTKMKTHKAIN